MFLKFLFFSTLTLIFQISFCQLGNSNKGINFQGIARNVDGSVLQNKKITVRLSILNNQSNGSIIYQEIKMITTNIVGLFSIIIGDDEFNKIEVIGPFSIINWKDGTKYLKIEIDPNNSIDFFTIGIYKINFVPYAHYALSVDAENINGILPIIKGGTGSKNLIELKNLMVLDKVNNTSDNEKPISLRQQIEFDKKMNFFDTAFIYNKIGKKLNITDTILLSNRIDQKMNFFDTAFIYNKIDKKLNITDTILLSNRIDQKMNFFDTAFIYNRIDRKLNMSDTNALSNRIDTKENLNNKSLDFIKDSASDIKYPSNKTIKNYIENVFTENNDKLNLKFEPLINNGNINTFLSGDKSWKDFTSSSMVEGDKLFFTNERARSALSLTNTGNNGIATYVKATGILNIPNYTLDGLGGESPLVFTNGLKRLNDSISIDSVLKIVKINNIYTNGFIKSSNLDGTLTIDTTKYISANQNIILSGDINGSGTNEIITTIGSNKISNSMLIGGIDLTSKVVNTLSVLNGGTGKNTLTGVLLGNGSNSIINAANASFYDTTQQVAMTANTSYPMQLSNTDFVDGITLENNINDKPTRVRVARTGKYNFQFSAQINRIAGTSAEDVSIWVRKNGFDIPATCTDIAITGSATTSAPTVASWNFFQSLNAGDYIELIWSTTNTQIILQYIGQRTSPIRPSIPSLILTVHQVY